MHSDVRVIALGSPHGDDRAGWMVAQSLAGREIDADVVVLANPLELLEHLAGCAKAIVVDAALVRAPRSGPDTHRVRRLTWPDSLIALENDISSHGVGLCYALRMAEKLGRLPRHVVVYAIETTQPVLLETLSEAAQAGVAEAARRIVEEEF